MKDILSTFLTLQGTKILSIAEQANICELITANFELSLKSTFFKFGQIEKQPAAISSTLEGIEILVRCDSWKASFSMTTRFELSQNSMDLTFCVYANEHSQNRLTNAGIMACSISRRTKSNLSNIFELFDLQRRYELSKYKKFELFDGI